MNKLEELMNEPINKLSLSDLQMIVMDGMLEKMQWVICGAKAKSKQEFDEAMIECDGLRVALEYVLNEAESRQST